MTDEKQQNIDSSVTNDYSHYTVFH